MATQFSIGSLSANEVFETLQTKGLTASEASTFIGQWILETVGKTKRVFEYKEPVPETDPNCVSKFARKFAHQDWEDGVSVVQASETAGELGFNTRFHSIETDLDALSADVATAFACIAALRKEMRHVLDEIRTEINRINTDVDACCNSKQPPLPFPTGPLTTGTFGGFTKLNGKQMQVWNTNAGMIMVPDLEVVETTAWTNPRAARSGKLARFIEETPAASQTFPAAVSKKDFLTKFGNERLADGSLVRELVDTLPDGAQFTGLDAMVSDLTEREAAALRTTEGARESVSASLGLGRQQTAVGTAPLDQFRALPAPARQALLKNGIDTLAKFAELPIARVSEILRVEKVTGVTAGDLAEAGSIAKTLSKLG